MTSKDEKLLCQGALSCMRLCVHDCLAELLLLNLLGHVFEYLFMCLACLHMRLALFGYLLSACLLACTYTSLTLAPYLSISLPLSLCLSLFFSRSFFHPAHPGGTLRKARRTSRAPAAAWLPLFIRCSLLALGGRRIAHGSNAVA